MVRGDDRVDLALLTDGLARRARAGHHHRRGLPLLLHGQTQVHHRRHAGPRAVHAQHGHRRLDERSGHHPDRRPARRADADASATASSPSLLRHPPLVVAVNKMDLVDYSEDVYDDIVREYSDFVAKAGHPRHHVHSDQRPATGTTSSARSDKMPWYDGHTLLHILETVHVAADTQLRGPPFPGAVRDPARPGFPGLCRHDRVGRHPCR